MSEEKSTGRTAFFREAFEGLDKESLDTLRHLGDTATYTAGEIVCGEGELGDRMFVLTRGRVVVTQAVDEDEERVLGFRGPGEYFGEMSLITEQPRMATVRTLVETEVLAVTKEVFAQVFETSPTLARSLLRTMIINTREADKAVIAELGAQHEELREAYDQLQAAQAQLVAKERMERELEIAGDVQRSLMPVNLPSAPNFQFAARFQPARQVGGDFYDVRELPDGKIGVLLADVSDKGAHAALFMAVTRTLFLSEARYQLDPVAVVQAVHQGLLDVSTSEMFVTVFYGVLDPASGHFRYVRAGHDEPLWVGPNGKARFLGGEGRFLGVLPGHPVEHAEELDFQAGDCLVVYSDGVTDMSNVHGVSFGAKALEQVVVKNRKKDAEDIAQALYDAVEAHRQEADAFDDVTLLVVRAN